MTAPTSIQIRLFRLEEARRQTQHQLDLIDRQIVRRITGPIPKLAPKRTAYQRGKAPDPETCLERYRGELKALTAERQPEIDALARRLAHQDDAIAILREPQNPRSSHAA